MKKAVLGIGLLILFAIAAPLFAQGPFADVPTDHWAYEAVNELQRAGIVIGYPDGTFGGKRAMTRYEFAVAIARAIPIVVERVKSEMGTGPTGNFATKEELNELEKRVAKLEGPKPPSGEFVTKEQFNALESLVNEFRDELASLGVDVDALKRDVAALAARVSALEKEMRRVKWNGVLNTFATATHARTGLPIDRDGRPLQPTGPAAGKLINSVSFVRDMDLTITGSLTPSFTTFADIDFGNYLPAYLGGVITNYVDVGTERSAAVTGKSDEFIPYYLSAAFAFGSGSLEVGRIPVQFTPYTLKLIDVDSYTVNEKTDSGDYPLDGGKLTCKFGNVGLTAFAAKTDENSLLGKGLVSQPTIALYGTGSFIGAGTPPGHAAAGHAAGGLDKVNQAAGARLSFGTPLKGNLGVTYLQAAGPAVGLTSDYDTAEILGGDLKIQLGQFPVTAEYAQSKTKDKAPSGAALPKIDDDNKAWDGAIGWQPGKLAIDLGYRQVERNFGGPGYWTKVGRWTNPTNIRGPYANLTYGLAPNVSLVANGAFYKGAKDVAALPDVIDGKSDKLWKAEGGLKWGFTTTNSVNLGIEYIRWDPADAGAGKTKEQYINIGLAHQFNPSAGLNISYQIIDYKPGAGVAPYGTDKYKGGVAVAQIQAKF